ncbi:MAG: hypothetical protein WD558_09820 [Pseudomonadales bacterium]
METDRRRHARYHRANLELDVARPGIKGILALSPTSECMDFCLAGLRFGSRQQFETGEYLVLDLRVYGIVINELAAEVMSCTPEENGSYCTGVRFCFEQKSMQNPEISHALLHIEDRLRAAQKYPFAAN